MPARLHHEPIASGDPARWLALTHGICGSGGNWRTIARKLVARRPDWGVQLVDLRQHGRSEPGEPPHTIAACADDLRVLIAGELAATPVAALAGHSFGGKVVIATRALVPVVQTWTIDSAPEARTAATTNDTVLRLLALVDRSPRTWARREDFVAALVADGHPMPLAQWFAMNLVPVDGGRFTVRLDTAAIRELLADYGKVDLWAAVHDPSRGDVELVIASRSTTYTALPTALPPHVHATVVEGGHWLHVDNPDAVVELFAERLPR